MTDLSKEEQNKIETTIKIKLKESQILKKLNESTLRANIYLDNLPQIVMQIKLSKGIFSIEGETIESAIENTYSQEEILILAYEASKSPSKDYQSKTLGNIFTIRKMENALGTKDAVLAKIEKEISEIEGSTIEEITREVGFIERKEEQIYMLKDPKTRKDGLGMLFGMKPSKKTKTEKVKRKLTTEEKDKLQTLYEIKDLLTGEALRRVQDNIKIAVLIESSIGKKTENLEEKEI